MQLTTLVEVATFWQGNHSISGTLLSIVSATERSMVNWAEWFKVGLHKEVIVVHRKVGKIGNSLIGPILPLWQNTMLHYNTQRKMKRNQSHIFNAQRGQGR